MRIALYSDQFSPELSGIADAVSFLGKIMSARGHAIAFVAPQYPDTRGDDGQTICRITSLPLRSSPNKQSRIAIPLRQDRHFIKEFKPDIIHTHSPWGVGLNALMAAKSNNIPLVGTNHTRFTQFLIKGTLRFYPWYYNRCDFVTSPSKTLMEEMQKYGFKTRHRIVPNTIDLQRFTSTNQATKDTLKKKFGFSSKTIIYTGRLAEEKHVDVLIKSVAILKDQIPDINLILAGIGKEEEALHRLVEDLNITEVVKFLGFVTKELPSLYQAADLFVIMSTAEAHSLSLLQAMASSLPVIVARTAGLSEHINSNNGLVVNPGDENNLAEAILKIFNNPQYAQLLGETARASIIKYSPDQIGEEWEDIYTSLIKEHSFNAKP
jgi:glycosyltransferase involved in cell wall biosynthesis